MKGYFPHILVSLSLAVINEASPSRTAPVRDTLRNKRSLIAEAVQKHHQDAPGLHKRSKLPNYGLLKRNGLDTLDLDALFSDPIFTEMLAEEPEEKPFSNSLPEYKLDPVVSYKDDMSNVIPGALGPLEEQPRGQRMEEISGKMLDDFLWFLELKESGLLYNCMMYRRR